MSRPYRGNTYFNAVTVTDAASELAAANVNRVSLIIQNLSDETAIYLGNDDTVTDSTGLELAAGESLTDDASQSAWYAVTAEGTADVRIVEVA